MTPEERPMTEGKWDGVVMLDCTHLRLLLLNRHAPIPTKAFCYGCREIRTIAKRAEWAAWSDI